MEDDKIVAKTSIVPKKAQKNLTRQFIGITSSMALSLYNKWKVNNILKSSCLFNVSEFNLGQLNYNLNSVLNDIPHTQRTFIFTGERYNKKLELEYERVNQIGNIIERAIQINKNILNYKAEVFLTQKRLEYYLFKHNLDIEREAKAFVREAELLDKQHLDNLDKIDSDAELRKKDLQKIENEIRKQLKDLEYMDVLIEDKRLENRLKEKTIAEIDSGKISKHIAETIRLSQFNKDKSLSIEELVFDQIKDSIAEKINQEAELKKTEAKREKVRTDYEEWKANREKKKMDDE